MVEGAQAVKDKKETMHGTRVVEFEGMHAHQTP
jgi:hypothetical protein